MRISLKVLALLTVFLSPFQAYAAIRLDDEGVSQGYINAINFEGSSVSAARSGITGTITVTGGGSGDVEAVGDCASGACFEGTSGTTLTFNNAGGDATIDYDGSDFSFSKGISTGSSNITGNNITATNALIIDSSGDALIQADRGSNGFNREAAIDFATAGSSIFRIGLLATHSGSDAFFTLYDAFSNVMFDVEDMGSVGNMTVSGDFTISGDDLFMTTNTDRFVLMGDGTNYNPEAINLGTDTTGNYAAGDAEAGAALTGDTATSFFSTGTIEDARLPDDMTPTTLTLDGLPDTDHTNVGPKTATFNAGDTITVMDLVYMGSSAKWLLTDADAAATSGGVMLAISLESKTDTQAMSVALPGSFVRDDTWSWTVGAPLYVSATPGAITATQPSGTDDVIRVVGFAVSADAIYFDPSPDYLTHT